jgi:hypothetical protein
MKDMNERVDGSQADTMSTRLPDITRVLKAKGVHTAMASYTGSMLALIFLDANEMPMLVEMPYRYTIEIAEVFRSLLRKRHPSALTSSTECGSLDWNLWRDTLEHQHTVTHYGL